MVKTKISIVLLGVSILLVGCSQGQAIMETAASGEVGETAEPITGIPTNTNQTREDSGSVNGGSDTSADPTVAQIVEETSIPCPAKLTSPNQEGPFYSPGSPEKSSLIEEGMPGVPIMIFGRVFDQDCNPIPGAQLDFWLADITGAYDNTGFRLRGHVFTDNDGNYTLESIEPTAYTGRPPHIHVKLFSADGEQLLTTQMYFAGSEGSGDVSLAPDLLATYLDSDEAGRQRILFNFVVQE